MRHNDAPPSPSRAIIYQLVVRLFGNTNETVKIDGTIAENGCGLFADIDERALRSIRELGATHIWLTGVLRQATLTDYSSIGCPADRPDVVKGRAGSFYAVRDYYDVSPDYALDPEKRMDEFDALIARIHEANLGVLIDLVPNHVARGYGSVVKPNLDFGKGDDQTQFFSPKNDFFYVVDPPGQSLTLPKPANWKPEGVVFDGRFDRESGGSGQVPRVTGNNVVSAAPSVNDWYETIKLNYGYDFVSERTAFDPVPDVWTKIDAILAYWQARGVDGFRCDFAHYVPKEAWIFLIAEVKSRDAKALVIAEAYEDHSELLSAGFDALYDFETYNALKRVYLGRSSPLDLAERLGSIGDSTRPHYIEYLENHDERRLASALIQGVSEGETGFGSMNAVRQLGPLVYLYNRGPILLHNGQEVGEPGLGVKGYCGDNGRTSIFDYGCMPELAKWVNDHRYDGGRLSPEQRAMRAYYSDLLDLARDPAACGDRYWGLRHHNDPSRFEDANRDLLPFARFASGTDRLLVVVASFAFNQNARGTIRLPTALVDAASLSNEAIYEVRLVLSEKGKEDHVVSRQSAASLIDHGFPVDVGNQSAHVLAITRSS